MIHKYSILCIQKLHAAKRRKGCWPIRKHRSDCTSQTAPVRAVKREVGGSAQGTMLVWAETRPLGRSGLEVCFAPLTGSRLHSENLTPRSARNYKRQTDSARSIWRRHQIDNGISNFSQASVNASLILSFCSSRPSPPASATSLYCIPSVLSWAVSLMRPHYLYSICIASASSVLYCPGLFPLCAPIICTLFV